MKLIFLSKHHEVADIYSFWFNLVKPVTWVAGQSIRLEIKGEERRFSIVSAPFEKNIAIATRISDSKFKQALAALQPGVEIDGFNIEGMFTWESSPQPKILLASGVGITPFYSMFKQLTHDNESLDVILVYANRDARFLFGGELKQLQLAHSELKLEFLPEQRLSHEIIEKHTTDLSGSLIYLSGPEAMIDEMTPLLLNANVKKEQLKLDIFTGRPDWEV